MLEPRHDDDSGRMSDPTAELLTSEFSPRKHALIASWATSPTTTRSMQEFIDAIRTAIASQTGLAGRGRQDRGSARSEARRPGVSVLPLGEEHAPGPAQDRGGAGAEARPRFGRHRGGSRRALPQFPRRTGGARALDSGADRARRRTLRRRRRRRGQDGPDRLLLAQHRQAVPRWTPALDHPGRGARTHPRRARVHHRWHQPHRRLGLAVRQAGGRHRPLGRHRRPGAGTDQVVARALRALSRGRGERPGAGRGRPGGLPRARERARGRGARHVEAPDRAFARRVREDLQAPRRFLRLRARRGPSTSPTWIEPSTESSRPV